MGGITCDASVAPLTVKWSRRAERRIVAGCHKDASVSKDAGARRFLLPPKCPPTSAFQGPLSPQVAESPARANSGPRALHSIADIATAVVPHIVIRAASWTGRMFSDSTGASLNGAQTD